MKSKPQISMSPKNLFTLLFAALTVTFSFAQQRIVQDISKNNWQLWLDSAAQWQNDVLFTPPVDL